MIAPRPFRPFRLGLTGSIGMGKSTVARIFADAGVPVWDADATVHRLYGPGGAAVAPLGAAFPEALQGGAIDRRALKRAIADNPDALARIERIVHPLVAADRAAFLSRVAKDGRKLAVLDIPLLFETGAERDLDAVLVVTAPPDVQRARVLARPGMTEAQLDAILARQLPDAGKRRRADYIIESVEIEPTRAATLDLIACLAQGIGHDA